MLSVVAGSTYITTNAERMACLAGHWCGRLSVDEILRRDFVQNECYSESRKQNSSKQNGFLC